jgi:hypothetical protein
LPGFYRRLSLPATDLSHLLQSDGQQIRGAPGRGGSGRNVDPATELIVYTIFIYKGKGG